MYNISGILSPVLHPVLKDYQDRPSVLADKYTHIQKTMSLVAMFVFVACYAASDEIIRKVAFFKPFGLEPFESLVVKTICAAAIFLGYVLLTRQTEALLVFVPKKMRRKGRKGKL